MNKDDSRNQSLSVLDKLNVISALITIGISTYGAIQLLQGITRITNVKIVGLIVWVVLILVYFRKKSVTGKILVGSEPYKFKEPAYPKWIRYSALVGIIVGLVLNVANFSVWTYERFFSPDKIIILVADFDGPDPLNYRVTKNIFEQLNRATNEYNDVQIQLLGEVITYRQGSTFARAKGKQHNARIVLWGDYGKTPEIVEVVVHFEVLGGPGSLCLRQEEQTLRAAVAKLDRFEIQTQLSNEMSYLVLLTIGLVRYEAQDYNGAIERFTKALNYQNTVPEQMIVPSNIYSYRGNAYMYKGEYDLATSDYNKAIQINPNYAEAYNNRGNAYMYKGEYDLATSDYNKAIQINPNLAEAYYNRGNAYDTKGLYDLAITDFNKAIEINPNLAEAYYNRGNAYDTKGLYDLAITDFNKAIEINPNYAEAYNNRGNAYMYKGEYDLATSDYTKAIDINPNYAEAYYNRGIIYGKKGEYNLAIADYTKAIDINPKHAKAYYNRGNAHKLKGEKVNAIADFKKVLELSNDPMLRQTASHQLKELGVE